MKYTVKTIFEPEKGFSWQIEVPAELAGNIEVNREISNLKSRHLEILGVKGNSKKSIKTVMGVEM
jgi:hypothetical protein